MLLRNMNPADTVIQIGIDDGQGLLKVMMTVKEKSCDEEPDRKRSKYSEGYAAKDFKLSSVKKVFVLAVTKTVENHHNLSTILENLGLDAIDFGYSADLKMVAIICGKQNASSKHPCPWCDGSAPWTTPSSPTTIGSLWSCYHKWISNGADKSKAMEFGNVIYKPLLTGDNDVLICDIFNIPELHILTGVTGKLVQEFERKAFKTPEEGKDFMNAWLKKKGVRRCVYQGSASFEGNQADKLLKSVDSLEQAVLHETSPEVIIMALPFTQALRLFRKVCVACFGQSLDPNYTTYIQEFMASYRGLGISIPLKVHLLETHVSEFLKSKGEVAGLGFWSEQSMESCHHDFKLEMENDKISEESPEYLDKLKRTVVRYNGKHV